MGLSDFALTGFLLTLSGSHHLGCESNPSQGVEIFKEFSSGVFYLKK